MTFPISDQVNDQAHAQDLMEHLKNSLESLGKIKRKLLFELKMPTEKQVKKYAKLATQHTTEQLEVLRFSAKPKTNKEIQEDCLGLKRHNDNFRRYIEPLLNLKLLNRTLPSVPNSPLQKYFTTSISQMILLTIDFKSNEI